MFFGKISFTAPDKVPKTTNAMKKPNANQNMVNEPIESYRNRIPMRSWAEDDIPGNKLLLKGTHALSDSELLSIVIGTGIQGQNSLDIAQSLLSNCNNNLSELWKLGVTELKQISGIGENTAIKICAMLALGRRRNACEVMNKPKISNSRDAFELFKAVIGDLFYEEFWILILNKANRVLKTVKISEGGISGTVVDPKKIFKIALDQSASSIILGHNHPSENVSPSEADQRITRKMKECGVLLDLAVLDHIIVGGDRYYSFADEGMI